MGRCAEVSTQPPKHPQGPLGDFSPAQMPASKLVSALIGFVFLLVIRESNFPPRGKVGKPTKLILPWETLICNDSTKCCVLPQNLFKEARSVSLRGGGGRICQAGSSKGVLTAAVRPTDRRVVNNFLLLRMGVHRITKNKYVNVDLGVKR